MKAKLILIFGLCFVPFLLFSQYVETFQDADLEDVPSWSGSLSDFLVTSGQLSVNKSNPSSYNKIYLVTSSHAACPGTWKGFFELDCQPTSANYWRFYLTSSSADLLGDLQGYYVEIGGVDKTINLRKQTGRTSAVVIAGEKDMLNLENFPPLYNLKIKVFLSIDRTKEGLWTVNYHFDFQSGWTTLGVAQDAEYQTSLYSGLWVRFSKSHAMQEFFCDDLEVTGVSGTDPDNPDNPDNPDDNDTVIHSALRSSVVISEVMYDPTPAVLLPGAEYVELYNRSDSALALGGFSLQVGQTLSTLPSFVLLPHQYIALCDSEMQEAFSVDAYTLLGMNTLPTLKNTGDTIRLLDGAGHLVTWCIYLPSWVKETVKEDGGWSLERIDNDNLNVSALNWRVSVDRHGGTPSEPNSVQGEWPDTVLPQVSAWALEEGGSELLLVFSKEMQGASLREVTSYNLYQDDGSTYVGNVESIKVNDLYTQVVLKCSETLGGTFSRHSLRVHLLDVSGLCLDTVLELRSGGVAPLGAVLLNEVLVSPFVGGVEFVELYNNSEQAVALKGLGLSLVKAGELQKYYPFTLIDQFLLPHQYAVACEDRTLVESFYTVGSGCVWLVCSLPTLPDSEGDLALLSVSLEVMDRLCYSQAMVQVQLKDAHGVSLERRNPASSLWASASSQVGYATPGRQNSCFLSPTALNSGMAFKLQSRHFSPNGDGYEDVMVLQYSLPEGNSTATIRVFTPGGRLVTTLLEGKSLSSTGFVVWDGKNSSGQMRRAGLYVVLVEVSGETINRTEKLVTVLQ